MLRKTVLSVALMGLVAGTTGVGAQTTNGFRDYARVTHVEPIYRTVQVSTPVERCWNEPVTYTQRSGGHHHQRRGSSYTGPLLGGVVGGIVGNQFGGGDGRTLLTVAGAVLGASIGNDISSRSHRRYHSHRRVSTYTVNERRCSTTQNYSQRQEQDGYLVEYRYRGRTYSTRLDYHPGNRLPVSVEVVPQQ
ncbi:MAG: glycine zipper 2TM domain-containing protein [Pseudomonadota bacterium]